MSANRKTKFPFGVRLPTTMYGVVFAENDEEAFQKALRGEFAILSPPIGSRIIRSQIVQMPGTERSMNFEWEP